MRKRGLPNAVCSLAAQSPSSHAMTSRWEDLWRLRSRDLDRITPRFYSPGKSLQDLRHPHPAAVFNPFCATQQYRMSKANHFRQVRCDVAQCGRRRRKYDQVGIGAIAKFRVMCTESGSRKPGKIIAVFAGLLHPCDPIRVVAPENNFFDHLLPTNQLTPFPNHQHL
jgi:hypothetical protein